MLKKIAATVLVASVALLASRSIAQPGPGGGGFGGMTDQQMQQMQDFQQKMMQNMQDKNIDPATFFGELRQGIQDGTLDPNDIQQMMVDKGIIDQGMMDSMNQLQSDMQKTQQKAQVDSLKDQLGATDAEWAALQIKIQKVLDCMAVLGINPQVGRVGGLTGFGGGQGGAANDLSKALAAIRSAVRSPTTSDDDMKAKIKVWRDAHEKAKADLVAAQKDLTDLLTGKQEAILTTLGIL